MLSIFIIKLNFFSPMQIDDFSSDELLSKLIFETVVYLLEEI